MILDDLSKDDLTKLHTLILTLIKINKINYFSLDEIKENKVSLLYQDNLWYLFDMNDNDYILNNLDFACKIILRNITKTKEECEIASNYFYKLLLLNIPTAELQDYLMYYKRKEENKNGRRK